MELTEEQEFTMLAAREGYKGYCRRTCNKSVMNGDDLPDWDNLPPGGKNAWFAAADGIIGFLAKQYLARKLRHAKV